MQYFTHAIIVGRMALPPSAAIPTHKRNGIRCIPWNTRISAIGGTTVGVGRTDERHYTRLWCARALPSSAGLAWYDGTDTVLSPPSPNPVIKLIASYQLSWPIVINFIYGISLRRSTLQKFVSPTRETSNFLYHWAMCNILSPAKMSCWQDVWKKTLGF